MLSHTKLDWFLAQLFTNTKIVCSFEGSDLCNFKIVSNASAVATDTMTANADSSKVPLPGLARTDKMSKDTAKIPAGKNPFHTISNWTPELLQQVEIVVDDAVETTNDFTRSKQKAARYWSADVKFRYNDGKTEYESGVIKMTNNDIPYIKNESYGGGYFYATCNVNIGNAIRDAAAKKNVQVSTDDEKTMSSSEQWWKTINKAEGRVGILQKDGTFVPKDLHGILVKTESGIRASIDVTVKVKFNSKAGKNFNPNKDVFRIVFDCSRCTIKSLRNPVDPPPLESSVEQAPSSRTDIANDDLINELESLEI